MRTCTYLISVSVPRFYTTIAELFNTVDVESAQIIRIAIGCFSKATGKETDGTSFYKINRSL